VPREDTQWKPGQSGNPSGRPKGSVSIVALYHRLLREDPSRAERIVNRVLDMAEGGDMLALQAVKEITSRIDGAVPKQVNVTGDLHAKLVRLEGDDDDSGQTQAEEE